MYDEDQEGQPQAQQDAIASLQTDAIREAGLRTAKATDHRNYDDWSNDEGLCQRFLIDRPSTWRTAIQRYWRDRCTRRELATELGQSLETVKNLLRRIRKAVKSPGKKPSAKLECQWPRRPHTEINERDILAICDGEAEAIAHAEEYRRLSILNQLSLFSPAITGELVKMFEQAVDDAIEETGSKIGRLVAKADALKASAAKDDPFAGRPLIQSFTDARTEYHADRRGRPRKEKHAVPTRKRGRPRKVRDISDLRITPISPPIFLDGPVSHF
jgi:hypothetical protein